MFATGTLRPRGRAAPNLFGIDHPAMDAVHKIREFGGFCDFRHVQVSCFFRSGPPLAHPCRAWPKPSPASRTKRRIQPRRIGKSPFLAIPKIGAERLQRSTAAPEPRKFFFLPQTRFSLRYAKSCFSVTFSRSANETWNNFLRIGHFLELLAGGGFYTPQSRHEYCIMEAEGMVPEVMHARERLRP